MKTHTNAKCWGCSTECKLEFVEFVECLCPKCILKWDKFIKRLRNGKRTRKSVQTLIKELGGDVDESRDRDKGKH